MKRWDPGAVARGSLLHRYARLVRIEHTLFSLPFAYAGALLVGPVDARQAVLIFTSVLGLRTAAMAWNNIADLDVDAANPRTRGRPLVVGAVSLRGALTLFLAASTLFYASAALLNWWAALLAPLVWAAAILYPYAKRVHSLPHLHLGVVLGLTVLGGAVAVAGTSTTSFLELMSTIPWLYVWGVALWVAGFDVIYSIMDWEFDVSAGLGSVPAAVGPEAALRVAAAMHAAACALFAAAIPAYHLGPIAVASTAAATALIAYEHLLARRGDYATAFNVNLVVALLLGLGVIVDRVVLIAAAA